MFGRAQVSALMATVADFCVTALMFSLTGCVMPSTAVGAVSGGVLNCVVNYKWTFPGTQRTKMSVGVRYLIVWAVSILLNTFGTGLMAWFLSGTTGVGDSGMSCVMISRATVAVVVAVTWNYLMQKHFVYRR